MSRFVGGKPPAGYTGSGPVKPPSGSGGGSKPIKPSKPSKPTRGSGNKGTGGPSSGPGKGIK